MIRGVRSSQPSQVSAGNIVSIAIQLYRRNGNNYLLTSLLAHLWIFLTSIGVVVAIGVAAIPLIIALRNDSALLAGVLLLLALVVAGPVLFFAFGRFSASGGLLSRQMFMVLRQEEETLPAVRNLIYPRTWVFARSNVWVGVALLVTYAVLALLGYVLYVSVWPLFLLVVPPPDTWFREEGGFLWAAIALLLGLIVVLGFILVISYVGARLLLVDVVLAVEPQVNALEALKRSWQITRGCSWRILTVIFIGSTLIIPATLISGIANAVSVIPVTGVFFNVAIFPFWQGIKGVLYYDLRNRNEGLNLDLANPQVSPLRFMKRVCLQAPESVELDFALAGIGSRTLAWIVDQLCLYVAIVLLSLGGLYIYIYAIYTPLSSAQPEFIERVNQWALALYLLFLFVLNNGYYILFETFWQGQTPGKRVAQIRVVTDIGQPIGLKEAALRSLIQTVDIFLLFIGLFLILFTASEKRLGDMAAGTLVIQGQHAMAPKGRRNKRQLRSSLELEPTSANQMVIDWINRQGNISALTADQYLTIRDFLNQRQQWSLANRQELASKLAEQVRSTIFTLAEQDAQDYPELGDEDWLEGVYLAFRARGTTANS